MSGVLDVTGITGTKKEMIEALKKSLGIVSPACRMVGISRQTHYRWMREDENYKEAVLDTKEDQKDFVETQLMKLVQEKNPAAVIFANKTVNRDRGYSERVEVDNTHKFEITRFFKRPQRKGYEPKQVED